MILASAGATFWGANVAGSCSVGLVEGHEVARRGLESMLCSLRDVQVVVSAATPELAAQQIEANGPPEVLLVASDQGDAGVEHLRAACARASVTPKVIMLLRSEQPEALAAAARVAADGYLLESQLTIDQLEEALRLTAAGAAPIPRELARQLLADLRSPAAVERTAVRLTEREQVALQLISEGYSNKAIAARMGISVNGAKRHVGSVLAKLGCANRTVAATLVVRDGLPVAGYPTFVASS